jgi:hypothetical protein
MMRAESVGALAAKGRVDERSLMAFDRMQRDAFGAHDRAAAPGEPARP